MYTASDVKAIVGRLGIERQLRAWARLRRNPPAFLRYEVRTVGRAVAAVSDRYQRTALKLLYSDGFSELAAAQLMGFRLPTFKRIHREALKAVDNALAFEERRYRVTARGIEQAAASEPHTAAREDGTGATGTPRTARTGATATDESGQGPRCCAAEAAL